MLINCFGREGFFVSDYVYACVVDLVVWYAEDILSPLARM